MEPSNKRSIVPPVSQLVYALSVLAGKRKFNTCLSLYMTWKNRSSSAAATSSAKDNCFNRFCSCFDRFPVYFQGVNAPKQNKANVPCFRPFPPHFLSYSTLPLSRRLTVNLPQTANYFGTFTNIICALKARASCQSWYQSTLIFISHLLNLLWCNIYCPPLNERPWVFPPCFCCLVGYFSCDKIITRAPWVWGTTKSALYKYTYLYLYLYQPR